MIEYAPVKEIKREKMSINSQEGNDKYISYFHCISSYNFILRAATVPVNFKQAKMAVFLVDRKTTAPPPPPHPQIYPFSPSLEMHIFSVFAFLFLGCLGKNTMMNYTIT